MNWNITDKRYNPGKNRIQEYNIELQTTQKDNLLEVNAKVNRCPRRQRPVTWHATDVVKWLQEKGIVIESILTKPVLTDVGDCEQLFTFQIKNQSLRKTTPRKKKTATRSIKVPNTTETSNQTEED